MPRSLMDKLRWAFPDEVVNKRIARAAEVSRLPRFIAEYAVMKLCGDNPTPDCMGKLAEFVSRYYPEPRERDRVLYELMEKKTYKLLDEFKVSIDPKTGKRKVQIPSLGVRDAMILSSVLEESRELLMSGMWGIATLTYDPGMAHDDDERRQTPIVVVDFRPLQYAGADLGVYREGRAEFTTDEWMDVLMHTLGVNPDVYTQRGKLLYLSRLVPLVEENVNMLELGPRATGKSFIYKNVSYYVRLYSGGAVSPAVLFYHGTYRIIGDLGVRDCVVFDEISRMRFTNPDEMMGKLKDYMESGEFERGLAKRIRSGCSLVFMGNIEVRGSRPAEDFTEVMPAPMRDSAFVDRIHGFIPGWELPKIEQPDVHLSDGYGFVTDYFCEILHKLRKVDFRHVVEERVRLFAEGGKVTIRDQKAIVRVASGMLKVLFPHGEFSSEELSMVMDLAVEYRQRVHDWLCRLSPGEFHPKKLGYELVS